MVAIFILILVQSPNLIKFKCPPPIQGLSRRLFFFRADRAPFQGKGGERGGTHPFKLCRYLRGQRDGV